MLAKKINPQRVVSGSIIVLYKKNFQTKVEICNEFFDFNQV